MKQGNTNLEEIINKASSFILQDDYNSAKIILQDVAKKNPDNKKIKSLLGECYVMMREWDNTLIIPLKEDKALIRSSIKTYLDDVRLEYIPDLQFKKAEYLENLGQAYFHFDDYSTSAKMLEKKVRLFGEDPDSMILLANDYLYLDKIFESVNLAKKAYKKESSPEMENLFMDILFRAAIKTESKELTLETISHATNLINNNPEYKDTHFVRAMCFSSLNMYESALEDYYADHVINPKRHESISKIALYENSRRDFITARKFAFKAIDMHKKKNITMEDKKAYAADYTYLGDTYYMLSDPLAEKYYKKALQLDPDNKMILSTLGHFQAFNDKIAGAELILERLKENNADIGFIQSLNSAILLNKGKYEESFVEILNYDNNKQIEDDDLDIRMIDNTGSYINIIYDKLKKQKDITALIDFVGQTINKTKKYEHAGKLAILLVQKLGESIKYKSVRDKVMDIILLDPSLSDWQKNIYQKEGFFKRLLNKSKNPVEFTDINMDGLLLTNYVLKLNNPHISFKKENARLEKEYITNLFYETQIEWFFKDVLQKDIDIKIIPKPIVFLNNNKYAIFIQEKINAESLDSLTNDSKTLISEVEKSLGNLSLLHVLGISNIKTDNTGYYFGISDSSNNAYELRLETINKWDDFLKRAITGYKRGENRLGKNSEFKDFYSKLIITVGDSTNNGPIHGDAYLSNTLMGGYWVDFEKTKIGHPMTDLSALLGNPLIMWNNKINLLNLYASHNSYFASTINHEIPEYNYEKHFINHLIYDGFCQMGAKIAQDKKDEAVAYWQQTLELMQGDLKDKAVKYIKATKHEELKKVI